MCVCPDTALCVVPWMSPCVACCVACCVASCVVLCRAVMCCAVMCCDAVRYGAGWCAVVCDVTDMCGVVWAL